MIAVPLALLAKTRAVRWFWSAYPILVCFVIVMTANHFVLDAVLGAMFRDAIEHRARIIRDNETAGGDTTRRSTGQRRRTTHILGAPR